MDIEFLTDLIKIVPVIGAMVIAIRYFYKREKMKEKEIRELYKEIRDMERDNLKIIDKLADAIDGLSSSNEKVHFEISGLKDYIKIKLDGYGKR
jgi:hypothetical protein